MNNTANYAEMIFQRLSIIEQQNKQLQQSLNKLVNQLASNDAQDQLNAQLALLPKVTPAVNVTKAIQAYEQIEAANDAVFDEPANDEVFMTDERRADYLVRYAHREECLMNNPKILVTICRLIKEGYTQEDIAKRINQNFHPFTVANVVHSLLWARAKDYIHVDDPYRCKLTPQADFHITQKYFLDVISKRKDYE
ncbi:hypothetical protein [Bowmanella sp. JS7-9]|uniref:Uncharacterized protein n=1 Tax=Pseudobowmanella zhangzhouensis TaxID=1537679 RepID=A0ABW1XPB5_9ALTE|nr:hypothetical protein [Bowmanella sp. JS7-9]TBX21950.1 hypothetical protein TK45_10720 [Bowmanella sp. JS7-9]